MVSILFQRDGVSERHTELDALGYSGAVSIPFKRDGVSEHPAARPVESVHPPLLVQDMSPRDADSDTDSDPDSEGDNVSYTALHNHAS